jgi:hypothetical protein
MVRRILAAALLVLAAACGTTQDRVIQGGSPMIDEPTPPFPYNSKFCT